MQKHNIAAVISTLDKAHNRNLENGEMLDSVLRSRGVLTIEEKRALFDALDHLNSADVIFADLLESMRKRSNEQN